MSNGIYPRQTFYRRAREEAFESYKGLCAICGCRAVEIHHINLDRNDHSRANLVPLCIYCHNFKHGRAGACWEFHMRKTHKGRLSMRLKLSGIGKEIRKIQETLGMTDTQMAATLGVSQNTFWRWKHGRSNVREIYMKTIRSMAKSNNG